MDILIVANTYWIHIMWHIQYIKFNVHRNLTMERTVIITVFLMSGVRLKES